MQNASYVKGFSVPLGQGMTNAFRSASRVNLLSVMVAVGRGAFYRDRGDAVARDLEGGPGWQAREPPPPMPLRDFRERDRVRSLDR